MESNIKIETKVTLKIKDVKVSLTIEEARQLVQDLGQVVGKEYCTRQHVYTPYYPFTVTSGTTTVPLTYASNTISSDLSNVTTSANLCAEAVSNASVYSIEKAE